MITWKEGVAFAVACALIYYTAKRDFEDRLEKMDLYIGENKCYRDYLYCTTAVQGKIPAKCQMDCETCLDNVKRAIISKHYDL